MGWCFVHRIVWILDHMGNSMSISEYEFFGVAHHANETNTHRTTNKGISGMAEKNKTTTPLEPMSHLRTISTMRHSLPGGPKEKARAKTRRARAKAKVILSVSTAAESTGSRIAPSLLSRWTRGHASSVASLVIQHGGVLKRERVQTPWSSPLML